MAVAQIQHHAPRWKLALVGGVVGHLLGLISGPFSMFAFVVLNHYVYGAKLMGVEVFVSPLIGAFLGAVQGTVLGRAWPCLSGRCRRLTVARLMLVVAIAGPGLAAAVVFPLIALILVNTLLLLPALIAVLLVVDRYLERRSRYARTDIKPSPDKPTGQPDS
jgi:hypothetical protein